MKIVRIALGAAAILAAALSFGCDDNSEELVLDNIYVTIYSGNLQHERPGAFLADPLVVRVRDLLNNSKSGVPVAFSTNIPDALLYPDTAVTGADGLASCTFRLGAGEGPQHIYAAAEGDTAIFTIYAEAIACDEEDPAMICSWPERHIFIATTGSSLMPTAGSVVIDYDPVSRSITKVLETSDLLEGISFSPRGELFVSSLYKVRKVDDAGGALDEYITHSQAYPLALDPNPGGVLAGLWANGPVKIGCAPNEISLIIAPSTFPTLQWENVAVDPVTRDFHLVTKGSPIAYTLWRLAWDGRSVVETHEALASLQLSAPASAAGICVDSAGTTYVVFDGDDAFRRIVSVTRDGAIDYDFFDLRAHDIDTDQAPGRWGDVAYLDGALYLIDTYNDRLVAISTSGAWLDEHADWAFSRPGYDANEHYMIAASPVWTCVGAGSR